jgi:hypothetical protein
VPKQLPLLLVLVRQLRRTPAPSLLSPADRVSFPCQRDRHRQPLCQRQRQREHYAVRKPQPVCLTVGLSLRHGVGVSELAAFADAERQRNGFCVCERFVDEKRFDHR